MRKKRRGQERAVLAVLKPRSGASWPDRTEQWRRAAIAADTRRASSAGGRPLNGSIQFVSRARISLTASIATTTTSLPMAFSENLVHQG